MRRRLAPGSAIFVTTMLVLAALVASPPAGRAQEPADTPLYLPVILAPAPSPTTTLVAGARGRVDAHADGCPGRPLLVRRQPLQQPEFHQTALGSGLHCLVPGPGGV